MMEVARMNEFLMLAALIVFAVATTGLLLASVAHYAVASDPTHAKKPDNSGHRPEGRTGSE
jgi:hypothetical protein